MRASILTTVLFTPIVHPAATTECTTDSRLESGICRDLQQEPPSGLELLQHGERSGDRTEPLMSQPPRGQASAEQTTSVAGNSKKTKARAKSMDLASAESALRALSRKLEQVATYQSMREARAGLWQQASTEPVEPAEGQAMPKAPEEPEMPGTPGLRRQWPGIIRDLLPDSVTSMVDKMAETVVGIANKTLDTVTLYADNLLETSLTYKANMIRAVSDNAYKGIDEGTKALRDVVLRDFKPIVERWNATVQVLADDSQGMLSALDGLGYGDTVADARATFETVLETATNISLSLESGVSFVDDLVNLSTEDKKERLALVDSLVDDATARLDFFKSSLSSNFEQLITGFANKLGVQFITVHASGLQPDPVFNWQSLVERAKSMADKVAESIQPVFDGTRESAEVLLKSASGSGVEKSAAASFGVQLGLSLAAVCVGALWP